MRGGMSTVSVDTLKIGVGRPLKMSFLTLLFDVIDLLIHFSQGWVVCLAGKCVFDRGALFFCFVFFWAGKRK